jgi:hypothetical protein
MKKINMDNLKEQNIDELNNLDENQIEMEREHLDKIAKDLGFGPEVRIHKKSIDSYFECKYMDYWVAGDVCELLEIKDIDRAIAELDQDDKSELFYSSENSDSDSSEPKKTVVINYSGLFSLLFQSQSPIAKKLKRWVINEFLEPVFFTDKDCIYHINKSIVEEIQELGLIPFGSDC